VFGNVNLKQPLGSTIKSTTSNFLALKLLTNLLDSFNKLIDTMDPGVKPFISHVANEPPLRYKTMTAEPVLKYNDGLLFGIFLNVMVAI
jgi:hypothetical protein